MPRHPSRADYAPLIAPRASDRSAGYGVALALCPRKVTFVTAAEGEGVLAARARYVSCE